MQRHWTDHALETYWSFSSDECTLLPQHDASSRLGVAASLKFFQLEGYFPASGRDIPPAALHYMAQQLEVEPNVIAAYDWQGRTGKRYRGRLRTALGIRPATAEDCKAVETWLREEVVPWAHQLRHLQDAVLGWYRRRQSEPPTAGRMDRLVRSAMRAHEAASYEGTVAKLGPSTRHALDALLDSSLASADHEAPEGSDWRSPSFSVLKTDPGRVSLKSVLREWEKLRQIEALVFPDQTPP